MGFDRGLPGVFLVIILTCSLAATLMAQLGFNCTVDGATCRALVGYSPQNRTTYGAIQTLFQVRQLEDILGVNGLPESILPDDTVDPSQVIRIPFDCKCYRFSDRLLTGLSNHRPIYKLQESDTLSTIASVKFSGLIEWTQFGIVNNISDTGPAMLRAGQELWVPLPCSCDRVKGMSVVHYGMVLDYGTTLEQVEQEYGTTPDTILSANNVADPKQLVTGQAIDVPLQACSSMVRNDSLDHPLLVTNGTYVYTANNCVRCYCDAANNWILQCEPSKLKPTIWSTCPSMQCNSSNMYIGDTTPSSSHNVTICAYAGYGNHTIFTTLATESTPHVKWVMYTCTGAVCAVSLDNSRRVNIDNKNKWWIWLLVGVGVIVVPLLCYLCYVTWRKCKTEVDRMKKQKKLIWEIGGGIKSKTDEKDGKAGHEMRIFSFESISTATDNFSIANKLGEGGFGPVYKGTLLDGQEIAIKRLSSESGQGLVEFKNEAKLIAKLQHTNLVRLLGFCVQNEERILVYEYMPNKSLDFYLFDSSKRNTINWEQRLSIIEGIAQGLVYLHHFSRLKVIHRDLKASNILLDYEMKPKISNFGMARIFGLKEIEENTKRIVGTYGYMFPEYAMNGIVSVKTDVFSFGVLVLEIITGKKNNARYHFEIQLNLIAFAWQLWSEGRGVDMIDPLLLLSCNAAEVLRCIQVGLLCVQDRAVDRPSMLEVVSMLSNGSILLPTPKQPAFFIDVVANESNRSVEIQNSFSINEVTISIMNAR